MKYDITVTGMHCSGCKNLINLTLEEVGFNEIEVDVDAGRASFISSKPIEDIQVLLDQAFEELPNYTYSKLTLS